ASQLWLIRRQPVQICDGAEVLHLDAEGSGPARPPTTMFAIGAGIAAAYEVVVLVVNQKVEITRPVPGYARFGQLPAVEDDGIDVGGARLGGVLMGFGLSRLARTAHRGRLVDQEVGDLVPFGEIARFEEDRIRRYRQARLLRLAGCS